MCISANSLPTGDSQNTEHHEEEQPIHLDTASSEAITNAPAPQLPPEAQGAVHGGPLGCCLGMMVGVFLSLTIVVVSRLYADPLANIFSSNLSLFIRIALIIAAIVGAILFGYLGWRLGKRFYREYEKPAIIDRRPLKSARARSTKHK